MKQFWYRVVQWVEQNITMSRFRVVGAAIIEPPYDYTSLLKLEQVKLKEIANYFSKVDFVDHTRDIYWINICIKLIDIIIDQPEEYPYVNTKNLWRFIQPTDYVNGVKEVDVEHYYKSYPQDLRWVKAEHLYYEIRKEYFHCIFTEFLFFHF